MWTRTFKRWSVDMSLGDMVDSTPSSPLPPPPPPLRQASALSNPCQKFPPPLQSHHAPITPKKIFRPVPTVKLLQIMIKNSCRPTTIRTVTVGDADGSMLSKLWPAWSASHHDPLSTTQGSSTSTSSHCNRITRHHLQIGCSNIWSITQVFNKLNLVALLAHPCRRSWASAAAAVEGNSSSLIKIDRSTSLRAHCVYTEST